MATLPPPPRGGGSFAVLLNVVGYQLAWFACVIGAARRSPEVALLATAALAAWHLYSAPRPRAETVPLLCALGVGIVVESALRLGGFVRLAGELPWHDAAFLCMVALWLCFGTTLNLSLRALRAHPLAAALVGGFGAPLAYAAGARLGALTWTTPGEGLLLTGVAWAIALPLLLGVARRFDGVTPRS